MSNNECLTWIPEKRLFPPFKCLSIVTYPVNRNELPFHDHAFFQSCLVVAGEFIFHLASGERLRVKAGEMAVIPRGCYHTWLTERRCKVIQLASDPMLEEDYGDLSALFGTSNGGGHKISLAQDDCGRIVRRLLPELKKNHPGSATIVHACLLDLCATAFRAFCKAGGVIPANSDGPERREVFIRALEFMRTNYRRKLSLKEIAAHSFLGTSRFSEIFRRHAGISPVKYLAVYRIERAKTLLAFTDMSVSEVAEHLGFDSIHYFSKAFKQFHGREPSHFSRHIKKSRIVRNRK